MNKRVVILIGIFTGFIFLVSSSAISVFAQSCASNLPPRLTIGEEGISLPGQARNLRDAPSLNSNTIGVIQPDTAFVVLDGPTCGNGYYWYQVQFDGTIGWTAESGGGAYWLAPIDLPDANRQTCTVTSLRSINLRTGPGTNFAQEGSRVSNSSFTVDAQETDDQGFIWWRVSDGTIDDGLWVREDLVSEANNCSELRSLSEIEDATNETTSDNAEETQDTSTSDDEDTQNAEETTDAQDTSTTNSDEEETQNTTSSSDNENTETTVNSSPAAQNTLEPLSDTEIEAITSDPSTVFFYDFSDEDEWDGSSRGTIIDERLRLGIPREDPVNVFRNSQHFVSFPFIVQYDVAFEQNGANFYTDIVFNYSEFEFGNSQEQFSLVIRLEDDRYGFGAYNSVFIPPVDFDYSRYSGNVRFADSGEYRIRVEVTQAEFNGDILIDIFIDDVFAGNYTVESEIQASGILEISGGLNIRVGTMPRNRGDEAFIDNVFMQNLRVEDFVDADGNVSFAEAETQIERLQLQYPATWSIVELGNVRSPNADYRVSHTLTVASSPQGFSGQPDEIAFSLYDGALVSNTTRIIDTRTEPLVDVLEAFTRFADGERNSGAGDMIWDLATIESTLLSDGREVVIASGQAIAADFAYIAFRSSDNRPTVMTFAIASGQLDEYLPLVLNIAATVDYPAPSQNYGEAEQALLNHLNSAYTLQFFDATAQSCIGDLIAIQGMGILIQESTGGQDGFNPVLNFRDMDFTVNTSGLFLEEVQSENTEFETFIRVIGNVERIYEDGTTDIIPHELYFTFGYEQYFGASVFRMENTGLRWVRCSGMIR